MREMGPAWESRWGGVVPSPLSVPAQPELVSAKWSDGGRFRAPGTLFVQPLSSTFKLWQRTDSLLLCTGGRAGLGGSYLNGRKGCVCWAGVGTPGSSLVVRLDGGGRPSHADGGDPVGRPHMPSPPFMLPLSLQRGVNTDSGSVCREASFEGISK